MFRYCVNATYGFYSPVTVQGFNSYGGGFGTEGRVDPGSVTTLIVRENIASGNIWSSRPISDFRRPMRRIFPEQQGLV